MGVAPYAVPLLPAGANTLTPLAPPRAMAFHAAATHEATPTQPRLAPGEASVPLAARVHRTAPQGRA